MGGSLPRDKIFPLDSVQCNWCGGWGCDQCDNRGWFTPADHPKGRRCHYELCMRGAKKTPKPIPPDQVAVYCCDECTSEDA